MLQEDSNGEFEIVDKKMAGPAPNVSLSGSGHSGNSMLTNVPPPSALPSFVTAPLPQPVSGGPPQATQNYQPPSTVSNIPAQMVPPVPRPSSVPSPVGPQSVVLPQAQSNPSSLLPPPVTSQPQSPSSTQPPVSNMAALDLGSPSPDQAGWIGWFKGTVSSVGSKVAEKAKVSMDTVITTLDPQMKELIHSGGDIDIFVASDKEVKVGAVREAFQTVFGKATVSGMPAEGTECASQPVGAEAVMQSAEQRINCLRSSGKIHPQQPIIAVENFIIELTPDSWYDLGFLLLDDPWHDIILQTFTQMTPVPLDYVNQAKQSTPSDYPYISTGFSTSIGQIASQALQVHHTQWQETLCGVPRRDMIILAARSLAGIYKVRLPQPHYQASNVNMPPPI